MTPAAVEPGPPFRQNELLRWRGWDDRQRQWNVREVNYTGLDKHDPTFALVEWGMRHDGSREQFRVPLSELARPLPKPIDPRFRPPPVTPPPPPPTAITVPDIPALRDALRHAIAHHAEVQQAVDAATQLVSRAEAELASSRSTLAALTLRESDRARELEAALRSGKPIANGHDNDEASRSRAERDVAAAEQVLERFREEAREARGALADAGSAVHDAARKATAALFAAEAQRLVEAITGAKLGIWAEAAVRFVNEHRQRADQGEPWKALVARLTSGDTSADLS